MAYSVLKNNCELLDGFIIGGHFNKQNLDDIQLIVSHLDSRGLGACVQRIREFRFGMSGETLEVVWFTPKPNEMEETTVNEAWELAGHDWSAVEHAYVSFDLYTSV